MLTLILLSNEMCTTDTQLTSNESRAAGELPWTMQNTRTSKVQKSMALGVVSCPVKVYTMYTVHCTHAPELVHLSTQHSIRALDFSTRIVYCLHDRRMNTVEN